MSFAAQLQTFEAEHPYQSLAIDGCSFQYCLCGNPESRHTLVYLVGGTGDPSAWFAHVQAMEQEYRILLCDYPLGCDEMEPMVHMIARLTDALGIEKAVWIGASMGGYVAQLLTKFYPEKTDAQVLYATSSLTQQGIESLKKQYAGMGVLLWIIQHLPYKVLVQWFLRPAMRRMIPRDAPADVKEFLQGFADWTCAGYTREKDIHMTKLQIDLASVTPVTAADYAYIGGRTMLILPRDETAFTPAMQKDLIDTMQGAYVEYLSGGHLATLTRADAYAALTRNFLHWIDVKKS